jgi:phospholipid/cholesterol/gamma-HCH transport system ATP-binding protein
MQSHAVSDHPPPNCGACAAVAFERVSFAFDDKVVLRDLSFAVPRGGTRVLLGASGAGKSVVLKLILGLLRPDAGAILVNGRRVDVMPERELMRMRADIGMLFQENALFDSLTVEENVGYRLFEEAAVPVAVAQARVQAVLGFVGLGDYIDRMPAELSGGQRRRVAIARAMAAQPALLLFDDPTSGLDPMTATTIDDEIIKLRDLERVTSIVVTHQMRDALYLATHEAVREGGRVSIRKREAPDRVETRFMVLHEGRIWFEGSAADLLSSPDAFVQAFLYKTLPPW